MERLPQVICLAIALLPIASGCQTLKETRQSAMIATGLEKPPLATEFQVCWQNRLQQLPDPTKAGATISGLPGQMFLFSEDLQPAVPQGELTIVVTDETPRPNGIPTKKAEVWHFTKDKLAKMIAVDERFGKNFILFVPWPDDWRDVSKVRIKASYQQPGGTNTLYSPESTITLDFVGQTGVASAPWTLTRTAGMGVPDPNKILNQQKVWGQPPATQLAGQPNFPMQQQQQWNPQPPVNPGMNQQPVVPAGYTVPMQPQQQPPQQPYQQMMIPPASGPNVSGGSAGMAMPAGLPQ